MESTFSNYYSYTNPQKGDARWQKASNPAADKKAFDCSGNARCTNRTQQASGPQQVKAEYVSRTSSGYQSSSRAGNAAKSSTPSGLAKIVGGAAMALVAIPMLILPGPGILFIGGGIALAASGLKDLTNPR